MPRVQFPLSASVPVTGACGCIEQGSAFQPCFGADGLIPAVVTCAAAGDVLMFAYMTEEAVRRTLETGEAHFWSRSRGRLWRKGEESGNVLRVKELRTDCDQDVLWLRVTVEGEGKTCHTGARSCFYRQVVADGGGIRLVPVKEA